jgi:hypothetical protein
MHRRSLARGGEIGQMGLFNPEWAAMLLQAGLI